MLLAITMMFAWTHIRMQRYLSMAGSIVALIIAIFLFARVWQNGILTLQAGNWAAPFGITFVADTFAVTLVLLTAIAGLAVSVYSAGSVHNDRLRFGFLPVFHFLLLGLNGAFLTGDIFNLYVWFEIIIISSFVLITIGGEKKQLEGAVKYFTMNILASVIFLTACGVLYGIAGTLNMADLALKIAEVENRGIVNVCALLFFIGFGIKSAVFPLYFWLPASYHTPPDAVSAIFGGLLTKVGVYAMIRVFTLIFSGEPFIEHTLLVIAALTLFAGGMGALVQNNVRKIFSYLIICHIGYMIAGLGMFTEVAITGAVFYLIHDIVVKTNLFMVSGLLYKITGFNKMSEMGGIYSRYPLLALVMIVPLFSLVGVPPMSGFWPKISLVVAAYDTGSYVLLGFILFASFITLFIIARMWSEVFWTEHNGVNPNPKFRYFHQMDFRKRLLMVSPVIFLGLISLYIGFGAAHIQSISTRIAHELTHKNVYIEAVLGTVKSVAP
jgi:multicomponent Na+:H+ antiporter subunit D